MILDDADLARAIPDGVGKCYLNSGQTCSALTRMLVPREKLAEAEEIAKQAAEAFTPGDPFDEATRARAARLRRPARAGPRLHREGRGRGGEAPHRRRRAAGGPRPRLLRPPDRLLRGDARDDDRPGGDLRAGPLDPALRGRGRRGADRQRHRLRPRRRRLVGGPGPRDRRRPAHPHRPDRDQRRRLQPARPVRRLQAVRATAARTAATRSRSCCRSSPCSCEARQDRRAWTPLLRFASGGGGNALASAPLAENRDRDAR